MGMPARSGIGGALGAGGLVAGTIAYSRGLARDSEAAGRVGLDTQRYREFRYATEVVRRHAGRTSTPP
jgi:hypothetical protein